MITKIKIKALKSIRDLTINCSNLNLFVGTNSSGKSTLIQALLLVKQNEIDEAGLNGKYVSLGDFREVRNHSMNDSSIRIDLWGNNNSKPLWVEFKEDKENDGCSVDVPKWDDNSLFEDDLEDSDEYSLFAEEGFRYLSCQRIGAKDVYDKNIVNDDELGNNGEFALAYLLKNESRAIKKEICIIDKYLTNSYIDQVNYWLEYIIGMKLLINNIKKTNYLQAIYNNNHASMNSPAMYSRPVNVGSGVSYLISSIITCLGSSKGEIIIIENPEIHLHPKAQSRLLEFLYFISSNDRQLFIETHSDHIFNGIRVGVANGTIDKNAVSVNFLTLNNYETKCNPIEFGVYGKITGINEEMDINDLFDQFEIDLDKMMGF